ncbi:uncharacterized protein LOC119642115 [Glossina fuscipes]|uniref:Uncharacterized protein LOC119642115 n=1 Tax=Glossina fuscipes TaxID=7396 RepID=A0A9C5ZIW9_9MUSC|nr:uncharacterized protein LOC119642115 [Glossina fuscipes]
MKLTALCFVVLASGVLESTCSSVPSGLGFFGSLVKPFEQAGAELSDAFSSDNLKETFETVKKPLEDAGTEVLKEFSPDKMNENLEPIIKPAEEAYGNVTEAFKIENLQNNLKALEKPLNDALTSVYNNDCVIGIVYTLVKISEKLLLDVMVCHDGSLLYIKYIVEAAQEIVHIGKDLQLAHQNVCETNKAKCAETFTVGITKMIKQMFIISGDGAYLKLSNGMCAANILVSFAENLQIADLHDACST